MLGLYVWELNNPTFLVLTIKQLKMIVPVLHCVLVTFSVAFAISIFACFVWRCINYQWKIQLLLNEFNTDLSQENMLKKIALPFRFLDLLFVKLSWSSAWSGCVQVVSVSTVVCRGRCERHYKNYLTLLLNKTVWCKCINKQLVPLHFQKILLKNIIQFK